MVGFRYFTFRDRFLFGAERNPTDGSPYAGDWFYENDDIKNNLAGFQQLPQHVDERCHGSDNPRRAALRQRLVDKASGRSSFPGRTDLPVRPVVRTDRKVRPTAGKLSPAARRNWEDNE